MPPEGGTPTEFRYPQIAGSRKIGWMARFNSSVWRALLLLLAAAALGFAPPGALGQNRGKGSKRARDVSSFRKLHGERRAIDPIEPPHTSGPCFEPRNVGNEDRVLSCAISGHLSVLASPVAALDRVRA